MPAQSRLGDKSQSPADAHGCPACPHPAVGPGIVGSPNVLVNGRPALRKDDPGIHAACCGPNLWQALNGSSTVLINGKPAHRLNDMNQHCGGVGRLILGSENVIVGDSSSGGGGGGAGGGGGGGEGGGSTASGPDGPAGGGDEPPAQTQPKEDAPPAAARWQVVYDDGSPVRGIVSRYVGPAGGQARELPPDGGGNHSVDDLREGHGYHVSLVGTKDIRGTLQGPDGKPLANAELTLHRAFGDPVALRTDGSGAFQVSGVVAEEPFDITLTRAHAPAGPGRGAPIPRAPGCTRGIRPRGAA